MSKHFVFCWELGGGFGHISQMATVAQALILRGHRVTAILKDMTHASTFLTPLGVECLQAPQPGPFTFAGQPINHADILWGYGYREPALLSDLLSAWQVLFTSLAPDVLVVEAAPTAALMGRCLAIPTICLDIGFFAPPLNNPLPVLRSWEPVSKTTLMAKEERVLQAVNAALEGLCFPPLLYFTDLFDMATYWLTWPEFNHFGAHSADRHLGPILGASAGKIMCWPEGTGTKAFAYLRHSVSDSLPMLKLLLKQGYRVLACLPDWPAPVIEELKPLGDINVSVLPVDLSHAVQECDVVVCHGGIGTINYSLRAGKPMLLLPGHVEQLRQALPLANLHLASLPALSGKIVINNRVLERAEQAAKVFTLGKASAEESLAKLVLVLET